MRKKLSVFILFTMCLSLLLCGCTSEEDKAKVYYLNFKPEVAGIWEEIAEKYTEETGVEMKVLTAASGIYEQPSSCQRRPDICYDPPLTGLAQSHIIFRPLVLGLLVLSEHSLAGTRDISDNHIEKSGQRGKCARGV